MHSMNNSVIQNGDHTFIRIDEWYIGIHIVNEHEIVIFADHNAGKVVEDVAHTEDEYQWGKTLYVESKRWFRPRGRRTLFNRVRVFTPPPDHIISSTKVKTWQQRHSQSLSS